MSMEEAGKEVLCDPLKIGTDMSRGHSKWSATELGVIQSGFHIGGRRKK